MRAVWLAALMCLAWPVGAWARPKTAKELLERSSKEQLAAVAEEHAYQPYARADEPVAAPNMPAREPFDDAPEGERWLMYFNPTQVHELKAQAHWAAAVADSNAARKLEQAEGHKGGKVSS